MSKVKNLVTGGVFALVLFVSGISAAQAADSDDKPFAEAHIVLQLGDADPAIQARTISVANNLIKHYGGPEFVDLEIVAYGPGISLLYPSNPANERVSSLLASDVRFVGCMNTVETIARTTGTRPELISETIPVKTGVAHLVERAGQGYVVIRP
jgi:intracellular sulfur oxidation DsrE/DsrF family protein